MVESIEWFRLLILNHTSLEYLIVLLVTTIGGEVALFFMGFIVAQGILPFFPTFLVSFIGAFLPNIFWFFLGKTKTVEKTTSHNPTNATFLVITEAVRRVSRGNHTIAFIIIKFLVGTPFLLTIYINKTLIKFKQFMYYESIAIFLSVGIIMFVGYIGGRGFSYITEISKNLYVTTGFLLFVIFIITVFQIWLEKAFMKKGK
jgi:membrane protein DedA with SNARE-associated domain